jgi:hypothetical protein
MSRSEGQGQSEGQNQGREQGLHQNHGRSQGQSESRSEGQSESRSESQGPRPRRVPGVRLGIDLGSTELRAAWAIPGGPARIVTISGERAPWLLCEQAEQAVARPGGAGGLPVTFPSLKNRLGRRSSAIPAIDGALPPEETVARLLVGLREEVESAASAAVTHAVFSVPAAYGSAQRGALLDAAHRAGLRESRLISDSAAAVMGHVDGAETGTYLVYGMGYGGFELGLIRSARGQYRALGYETAGTSGGRAFDEALLAGALRLAAREPGPVRPAPGDEAAWHRLRAEAQRVREWLGAATTEPDAVAELRLGEGASGLRAGFSRRDVDAYLDGHVKRVLDRALTLSEATGMEPSDVDAVLLTGGCTHMTRIALSAERLGRSCVRAGREQLALGALSHASGLGPVPVSEEWATAVADPSSDTFAGRAPRLKAVLMAGGGERTGSGEDPEGVGTVAEARRLAREGRGGEAKRLLHRLIGEAQQLLVELGGLEQPSGQPKGEPQGESQGEPSGKPPSESLGDGVGEELLAEGPAAGRQREAEPAEVKPGEGPGSGPGGEDEGPAQPGATASRWLEQARTLLDQGRYDQAVRASHAAWKEERSSAAGADMLDAMIDVHCEAAMAHKGFEGFAQAERWLLCAYNHDPTSPRLRELLAERTYRHAAELHKRGRRHDTAKALRKTLEWNPEHAAAELLLKRLTSGGLRPRGGP